MNLTEAVLQDGVAKRRGVHTFLHGVLSQDDAPLTVATTGPQGSGILRSMSLANCLIDLPEEAERLSPGDSVAMLRI